MKYNIITHITTACNYDCSYCDVIKDNKNLSSEDLTAILKFVKGNYSEINRFKFFGGEPLLAFENMKYIINNSYEYIGCNYEIVTNTTLLKPEVGEYFQKYFSLIFFSIDTENNFNYTKVQKFIENYNLEPKLYFNLVINPGYEHEGLEQFKKLYSMGMRGFNILPVYFTKEWSDSNLKAFSLIMKEVLQLKKEDCTLRLYGFGENRGYTTSLANNTIFINVDGRVYYSDMASTFSGKKISQDLFLGEISDFSLNYYGIDNYTLQKDAISRLEKGIYSSVKGQLKLKRIMDYFSTLIS